MDTHCHLDSIMKKFELTSYEDLKKDHIGDEVDKMIHISCEPGSIDTGVALTEAHDEIYLGVGIHPHDAKEYNHKLHDKILNIMEKPKVLAWGEIGLDYHYDFSPREKQKEVFAQQFSKATQIGKNIIIHTREADEDTLEIMQKYIQPETQVHIHCFTGEASFAKELLRLNNNIYFGFTGVITFKSAESIREAVKVIPMERLLLETDSPYMAPVPFRGKTCHPGHIPHIANKMAEVRETTREKIFKICRENTTRLYGI